MPVDFDPENRSEFACPKTLQIAVKELLPHLELACQGSVVKCAQIFASVMRQIGEPDVLTKIAAFDRFAEALEKLKPPPTGYELFRRAVADEVREDLGDGASLADVEKQIASRWKQLSKADRKERNLRAQESVPYGLSARASETTRKLYRFALKLVAPVRPKNSKAPTSLVPKIARLLGIRHTSPVWQEAIDERKDLDDKALELMELGIPVTRARSSETDAIEALRVATSKEYASEDARTQALTTAQGAVEAATAVYKKARAATDAVLAKVSWLPAARAQRKDAFPAEWGAAVERFWADETTPDPSEKAVRRRRTGPNVYATHQTHYQWDKTRDLLKKFRNLYEHIKVSYGVFQRLKPFFVKRGSQNTCMCRYCENLRQMMRALQSNRDLFNCLSLKRHHAARVIQCWYKTKPLPKKLPSLCRPLVSVADDLSWAEKKSDLLRLVCCPLSVDAHELLDGHSINNTHNQDTRSLEHRPRHWSSTSANRHVDRAMSALACVGCAKDEDKVADKKCAVCGDCARVWRDAAIETSAWGPLGNPTKTITYSSYKTEEDEDGNVHSDNELHDHKVHPSKFIGSFFAILNEYKSHYHTLRRQKQAHLDQERNFGLGQMLLDQDFAENFTIILGLEIQSAHWISKQVTIFITIAQHLDPAAWHSKTSALKVNDQVTTPDGWAQVSTAFAGDNGEGMVCVIDTHGTPKTYLRKLLKHRVIKSVAHITVSNDKDHDTWAVQHAMKKQFDWYGSDEAEALFPGINAQIRSHLVRSDGAGSHFKNKFTFHFLGSYKTSTGLKSVSWDIGCPGHGKGRFARFYFLSGLLIVMKLPCAGPWDGLAGFIKRTLRQRIIDSELNCKSEEDVYNEVVKLCAELKCEGKVDHWNVMWMETEDVTRPLANANLINSIKHSALGLGVRRLFSFAVAQREGTRTQPPITGHDEGTNTTSVVLQQFTCGCSGCTNQLFDDEWQIQGCSSHQIRAIQHLERRDNVGIAAARQAEKQRSLALAQKLELGSLVAMETGDMRRTERDGGGSEHGFHLARVIAQAGGVVWSEANEGKGRTFDNQQYWKGGTLVAIRLLDRAESDESGLTFKSSERLYVANATPLEAIVNSRYVTTVASGRLKLTGQENQRIEPAIHHC